MNRENRPLVTDELVEFEKQPVEVQQFRKTIDRFGGIYGIYLKLMKEELERCEHVTSWTWKHYDRIRGIYGIYLKLMKEKLGKMSTCNPLDLETL